jgi:hypothetical protein
MNAFLPYTNLLVSNHGLLRGRVAVALGLGLVDNAAHLLLLLVGQLDVARRPVLLEPLGLGGARDGDHALRRDPGQRDLGQGAALARRELLDLVHDAAVLVKVLALEFRHCDVVSGLLCLLGEARRNGRNPKIGFGKEQMSLT